jgi:hypothetical protein
MGLAVSFPWRRCLEQFLRQAAKAPRSGFPESVIAIANDILLGRYSGGAPPLLVTARK